jgi:hypothetical protein
MRVLPLVAVDLRRSELRNNVPDSTILLHTVVRRLGLWDIYTANDLSSTLDRDTGNVLDLYSNIYLEREAQGSLKTRFPPIREAGYEPTLTIHAQSQAYPVNITCHYSIKHLERHRSEQNKWARPRSILSTLRCTIENRDPASDTPGHTTP